MAHGSWKPAKRFFGSGKINCPPDNRPAANVCSEEPEQVDPPEETAAVAALRSGKTSSQRMQQLGMRLMDENTLSIIRQTR